MENDPIISADIHWTLTARGCHVCLAEDATAAMRLCGEQSFDIILINFKQKTIADGMALAKILSERILIPIIFITGSRQQDIQAAKDYNPHYPVIYKPFSYRQLWALMGL